MHLLYAAAHAEFPDNEPLGGGKAVADYLIREWQTHRPFPFTVLSPRAVGVLGNGASLTDLGERAYARFCRAFEQACTRKILTHDPARTVVLANDISEGPDVARLAQHGFRVVTIVHVDVVEYFTKFYLRDWIKPEWLTRWNSYRWLPDLLQLVFQKQLDCARHSARLVVPSAPMQDVLRRCYPFCPAAKIQVLPWGNVARPAIPSPLPYAADEFVILTLSRLSPEKGIERLLAALPFLQGRCRVLIAGAAAYMNGKTYEHRLRRLAARVSKTPVEFLGHVTGSHKAALLQRADLFISPSRHESYGLTVAEAAAVGCPIITHHHYGAVGTVIDCTQPTALARAIDQFIAARPRAKVPAWSATNHAATRLAELLQGMAGSAAGA